MLLLKDVGFELEQICDIYYNSKIQNPNNVWYIVELKYIEK